MPRSEDASGGAVLWQNVKPGDTTVVSIPMAVSSEPLGPALKPSFASCSPPPATGEFASEPPA
jgi:hypothetical protein